MSPRLINAEHHAIIRIRAPYRRWLILHYGNPADDLAIESGSRRACHGYLRALIDSRAVPIPLYTVFVKPKDYIVAFPGADR